VPLAVGSKSIQNDLAVNSREPISLECDKCKSQLAFLLQIYAPIAEDDKFASFVESEEDSFHRTLYVFICVNSKCLTGVKCLRSQLNRKNDFYSYEAPPSAENFETDYATCVSHLSSFYENLHKRNMLNMCAVCGSSCTKKCSKCSFAFFCSQNHQLFDWTKLNHKSLCGKYAAFVQANDINGLIRCWTEDENDGKLKYCEESDAVAAQGIFPEREIFIEPDEFDYAEYKKAQKKQFKYYEKSNLLYSVY
jgi:hypothetical protein